MRPSLSSTVNVSSVTATCVAATVTALDAEVLIVSDYHTNSFETNP